MIALDPLIGATIGNYQHHKTDTHTFQVVANKTVVITIGMAED